jgi:integrase
LPAWRRRPIASISRRDVLDLIEGIVSRGAEVQANRTLARLRALLNWAIEKDRVAASPIARMKLPTQEKTRDRVLSDDELRWLWQACEEAGWPFGPLVKLLILTAQRRNEVAGMTWAEVDFAKGLWTIPRHKAKNDRVHEVQLSEAAIAVLRSLPRIGDGLVFTTTGETAVSGFSKSKRRLDAAMLRAKRLELGAHNGDAIPGWTLHDLRRTAATGMARLNFPPHVVDKVLNHVSGAIRGVAAVYIRFAYLDERRAALEAWGRYPRQCRSTGSDECGGATAVTIERPIPSFHYTEAEWAEIEASIPVASKKPLSKTIRGYLLRVANDYRFDLVGPTEAQRKRALFKKWKQIAARCEKLRREFSISSEQILALLRGWDSTQFSADDKCFHHFLDVVDDFLKYATSETKEYAPLTSDVLLNEASPRVRFQSCVLLIWVADLGGQLRLSRHPKSGTIQGPLVKYFFAVTLPVMGVNTPSPESLPDIIDRQKLVHKEIEAILVRGRTVFCQLSSESN